MPYLLASTNQPLELGAELGKGGEGIVSLVGSPRDSVAKIYHRTHRSPERLAKLVAMIQHPPADATRAFDPPHVSIAWPTDIIIEASDRSFAGFLMPRIEKSPDIYKLYNPQLRAKNAPQFDWRHMHRVGVNLAAAIQSVHRASVVLGDVNQKNILVTDRALVTLVDTDSFQITSPQGRVFRCQVGSPEYTPPELQGLDLSSVDRSARHDRFGLGVLIFQLLMEGYHPFAGRPLDPTFAPDGNVHVECIRQGIFPYLENKIVAPPPGAPPFDILHPDVRQLFLRCFVQGHHVPDERPKSAEWIRALSLAENALVLCPRVPLHYYSDHLTQCPWCERAKQRLPAAPKPAETIRVASVPKALDDFRAVNHIEKNGRSASIPRALVMAFIPALTNLIPVSGVGYFFIAQLAKGVLAIAATLAAFEYQWKYALVLQILCALDAYILSFKQQRGIKLAEFDFAFRLVPAALLAAISAGAIHTFPLWKHFVFTSS